MSGLPNPRAAERRTRIAASRAARAADSRRRVDPPFNEARPRGERIFGSAKDPVNFAGMVAADVLRGDMPISHWDSTIGEFILDVREPFELAAESHPRAVNIPLGQLRGRLDKLPRNREIHVICRSGQRAYLATRILLQDGFRAKDVSGGMLSLAHMGLLDAEADAA